MSSAIFIDGNSLLHRAFYALPPTMKTRDGRYTNAVYGFLNMLFSLTQSYEPQYLAVAFDVKKHTFTAFGWYRIALGFVVLGIWAAQTFLLA